MNNWQEDLLNLLLAPASSPECIFFSIERSAFKLGFEYVAFGFQAPYPITQRKITLLNNYPVAWQERYTQAGYLFTDPTVAHGKQNQSPLLLNDHTFTNNRQLWAEAQDHGIQTGWTQSSLERNGAGSLLTLCRSGEALSTSELTANESPMRWLVQVAHVGLSRAILEKEASAPKPLTPREREVLQWTADGKSAQDVADILALSKGAVDFHLKNSMEKLHASNKTAAVARATLLGLLG
jgi:DNA-binding CsgD family transcriptional regulator